MSRSTQSRGGVRIRSGDYGSGGMRGYDVSPGYGSRSGRGLLDSGYSGAGSGYEMDPLLHLRSLQQRLSLRESQLALANSLLQQQQPYLLDGPPAPPLGLRGGLGALGPGPRSIGLEPPRMMMAKRRVDTRPGDYGPEFKRPRNDFSPRPRDRYRSRDSDEGNRSSQSRRSQRSSDGHSLSGKARGSADKYDPEKHTADEDSGEGEGKGTKGKSSDPFHCHVCNVNCHDNAGFRRHMNSMRHNDRMMGMLALHEEKTSQLASRMKAEKHLRHVEDEDKTTRGFCKICDMALTVRYSDHQAMTFHKKRVKQVTKGCGWCCVPSFKNFSEVLAHRETEEHKANQLKHEGKNKQKKDGGSRKRSIKVEIPSELARYNRDTTYGQMCVVPVTGWFCKLCNKFYSNELAAKDTHCKAEDHYIKYKRFVYAKLRAKAEAERDAQEKTDKEKDGEEEKTEDDAEEGEEEAGKNGVDDKEEGDDNDSFEKEDGEEGMEEEEEEAMLAGEGLDDDNMDADGSLLQEMHEASEYQTADDTTLGKEEIAFGESGSDYLTSEGHGDNQDEENLEGDVSGVGKGGRPSPRATRPAVNTSTPAQGGANKARRGRKVAK